MKRLALALLLLSSQALAANIQVNPSSDVNIVTVVGNIEQGDGPKFLNAVGDLQGKTLVALSSEGGHVGSGVYIGEVIRNKGFATGVPNGEVCSSICGIIWLAGNPRLIGPKAHIGFHAAYDGETMEEKGGANAVVGAFLTKLGLSYAAVMYVTSAPPDRMTWLSKEDADRLGIAYRIIDPDKNPKPFINNDTSVAKLSPNNEEGVPEATAVNLVRIFNANWSNPNLPLTEVTKFYAENVQYFGKTQTKADIAMDVYHNAQRWPYRRYSIYNNDVHATCGAPGVGQTYIPLSSYDYAACEVRATIDWHVANGTRKVGGLTQVYYGLAIGMGPSAGDNQITVQSENVINRHPD